MDRPSDVEFEPVAVAARGGGRRRRAARGLALVAPVVALVTIVGVGAVGGPLGGAAPERAIAEAVVTSTPLPSPAPPTPSNSPARAAGPSGEPAPTRPYWSGESRPPSGEDGLMGGLPFGTAWSWLTEGPNRP